MKTDGLADMKKRMRDKRMIRWQRREILQMEWRKRRREQWKN